MPVDRRHIQSDLGGCERTAMLGKKTEAEASLLIPPEIEVDGLPSLSRGVRGRSLIGEPPPSL